MPIPYAGGPKSLIHVTNVTSDLLLESEKKKKKKKQKLLYPLPLHSST